ncbi:MULTISPECIES: type II secretion system minor pseudopilin GspJ [unclassified Wenzhouxiangella]|uniref:type II secretion system minor pseudopilin GspJ n=1 Tax=unclassified Wenzhouxiangella TaxID=2613841 RepID=UPI000E32BF57|nr:MULTISPECIES: type II secretion system minor pseudopilin GspJ [unclassified Wenzhouxiangella]RFF28502.1 type II secretion system protein GspJ [Wenzhouxiangella sp. 15181]RFP70020.1 type II secretion system protein GspJ [Wenzhouxiangella sp. 15190]
MNGRVRGYTLVEVLVAVVVFGILSASAYVALDALSRAASGHRDRSEDFGALQVAVARLDADLRQLAARPVAAAAGRTEPALSGQPRSLSATRSGWSNPADVKRSTLQRFGWQMAGSELQRIRWPVTDRVSDSQAMTETVLPEIESLSFSYRDDTGGWQERWPPGEALARLPSAIEVVIDTRRFGRVRRVVVLK